jgi:hypothetical protein
MIEALESNPEAFVTRYRDAIEKLESADDEQGRAKWRTVVAQMRQAWSDWQGENSLHEMAFGEHEPTTAAPSERRRFDKPGDTSERHLPNKQGARRSPENG